MLTVWDDYPIHQTSLPVATTASNDLGRYDRHWLVMFDTETSTQVGIGLSVHPNRMIIDAAISITRNGHQDSVFASGPLALDRPTTIGPIGIHIIEPLRILHITLDDVEGMSADLTFTANTAMIEDSHMRRTAGPLLISERTRTVQFGTWSGQFTHKGETIVCDPQQWLGLRDRSWGSRTTGTVAENSLSPQDHSIWFTWTLLQFDRECLLAAVNESTDGQRESRTAAILPKIGRYDPTHGKDLGVARGDEFEFDIDYLPGTRRPRTARLTLGPRGAIDHKIDIDVRTVFHMKGLGYYHPIWKHGIDHGGVVVGTDSWHLNDLDPTAMENIHTQHVCLATREDGQAAVGLLEHLAIGEHWPSGLPAGTAARH